MAGLPYDGMPDYLRKAAQKNLATEDASISRFNDRVKYATTQVQQPQSRATVTQPAQSAFAPPAFSFRPSDQIPTQGGAVTVPTLSNLWATTPPPAPPPDTRQPFIGGANGENVAADYMKGGQYSSQLAGPGATIVPPSGYTSTGYFIPSINRPGPGVPNPPTTGGKKGGYPYWYNEKLDTMDRVDPRKTPVSGYRKIEGQPIPFPLMSNYRPRDMSKQRKLYGWGSANSQESNGYA